MALPRITPKDVEGIVKVRPGDDLAPFIETANHIIDQYLASQDPPPTDANQSMVCMWLAAHFYSQFRRRLASGSAGGTGETYEGKTGMYLAGTTYGQQAIMLDSTGVLSDLNRGAEKGLRKTSIKWMGRHRPEGPDIADARVD